MEVRLWQPLNALVPILVTLSGMVIEVRPRQFANAASPISVVPLGITCEIIFGSSLNLFSGMLAGGFVALALFSWHGFSNFSILYRIYIYFASVGVR